MLFRSQIAFALRQAEGGASVREVCRKMGVSEQTFYRWKKKFAGMGVAEVRRLKQLEDENRRFKLRRAGWRVNRKRVYRLYKEEGLCVGRHKPRRHKSSVTRPEQTKATHANESWSMDFMADQLFDGRRFRLLTIVDDCTRERLAIEVGQRLNGDDVARVLDQIKGTRGALPRKIRVDNGTEFTSKRLDQWAYLNGVRLAFSRPGKPTDNGLIEAFNGLCRAECLNENWFLSLADAKEKIRAWRLHYNTGRPHIALGSLATSSKLAEFAALSGQATLSR